MGKAARLAVGEKKRGYREEPRGGCHQVQFLKNPNPHPTQILEASLSLENLVAILNLSKMCPNIG